MGNGNSNSLEESIKQQIEFDKSEVGQHVLHPRRCGTTIYYRNNFFEILHLNHLTEAHDRDFQ
jgi:hypothetical protein